MIVPVVASVVIGLATWIGARGAATAWREARRRASEHDPQPSRLVGHGVAALIGIGVATAVSTPVPRVAVAAVPGEPAPATMRPLAPPPATVVASSAPPSSAPSASRSPTWTIAPGDHLWGLSRSALADALGRPPTDAETATYVAAVVERNRQVFAVPGDADLVFPGQVFVQPPLPTRGR